MTDESHRPRTRKQPGDDIDASLRSPTDRPVSHREFRCPRKVLGEKASDLAHPEILGVVSRPRCGGCRVN